MTDPRKKWAWPGWKLLSMPTAVADIDKGPTVF
jgi:hypothetical protein